MEHVSIKTCNVFWEFFLIAGVHSYLNTIRSSFLITKVREIQDNEGPSVCLQFCYSTHLVHLYVRRPCFVNVSEISKKYTLMSKGNLPKDRFYIEYVVV